MLTYLKISGGFGIFASAASDKIEAHPNTFRHHHQVKAHHEKNSKIPISDEF